MSSSEPTLLPPRHLTRSVQVLACLCMLALFMTRELSLIFLSVFVGLLVMGLGIERWTGLTHRLRKIQPLLALLSLVIAIIDFTQISRSFLLTVGHFLLLLQGLRLLALRTVRDHLGSILLSSMMMLSAATLSVEWSFFVFLILFLPLTIWNLILLNLTQESQVDQLRKGPPLTPREMDEALKGLFEGGFLAGNHPLWQRSLPVARLSTATAFLTAVLCCAFVFAIFPRFNFRGFRGQFLQPVHKTAFTTQVDLLKGSRIFLDNSVAMRVEIDPADRALWPGYIRGSTLNHFDGRLWSRGNREPSKAIYRDGGEVRLPADIRGQGPLLKQSIYLESMESSVLFGAPVPVSFRLDRPAILVGSDATFERWRGDTWRLHYSVTSLLQGPSYSSWPRFLITRPSEETVREPVNRFPVHFDAEPIRRVARSITRSHQNPWDKARAIESVLRRDYTYSLDPLGGEGKNPLHDFIFRAKRGNCEYFASAMCVMLRALEIPSRMVTGFYSQEWNERGHYFVVRMKNAHAWVEAYMPGQGWVQFDPSPRQFEEPEIEGGWWGRWSEFFDTLNLAWNRSILSYDMEKQVSTLRQLEQQTRQFSGRLNALLDRLYGWRSSRSPQSRPASGEDSHNFPWGALGMLGLMVMLVGIALKIKSNRSGTKKAIWFYPPFIKILSRHGPPKSSHQTLKEFIQSLTPRSSSWEADIQLLMDEYYRRRFNPAENQGFGPDQSIKTALKRLSQWRS